VFSESVAQYRNTVKKNRYGTFRDQFYFRSSVDRVKFYTTRDLIRAVIVDSRRCTRGACRSFFRVQNIRYRRGKNVVVVGRGARINRRTFAAIG